MNELRHQTTAEEAGQRLDHILRDHMQRDQAPHCSRAALQKAVKAGQCLVDGQRETRPDARLRAGQHIVLSLPDPRPALLPEEDGDVGDGKEHIEVLWHDEHLVVCNKPAGLTVHPCPSCPDHTLVQRLLARFPALGRLEGQRPGIVHRLDKETSGLLAVALTEADRLALSAAFAQRAVRKEYLALVAGRTPATGECREPLGRHPSVKTRMAVVPEARGGRPARTSWTTLWTEPGGRVSLLSVRIHTGRTHQIRVHLAHLGHPLLGDRLYAPKAIRLLAPRQMLHAWRLDFAHPATAAPLHFCCPPPADMLNAALQAGRRPRRLVITGNPGSGKSALLQCLAERDIPVISADAVVSGLYARGGEAARWLAGRRADLLADDGAVDKAALLPALEADPELRRELERVVHALARQRVETFFAEQEAHRLPLAAAEVPLYFEAGWAQTETPRPIVAGVRCAAAERARRLARQRGWDAAKTALLEGWQWPEARKMAACDLVVDNQGTLAALRAETTRLLRQLEARAQADETDLARHLTSLWSVAGAGSPA